MIATISTSLEAKLYHSVIGLYSSMNYIIKQTVSVRRVAHTGGGHNYGDK